MQSLGHSHFVGSSAARQSVPDAEAPLKHVTAPLGGQIMNRKVLLAIVVTSAFTAADKRWHDQRQSVERFH